MYIFFQIWYVYHQDNLCIYNRIHKNYMVLECNPITWMCSNPGLTYSDVTLRTNQIPRISRHTPYLDEEVLTIPYKSTTRVVDPRLQCPIESILKASDLLPYPWSWEALFDMLRRLRVAVMGHSSQDVHGSHRIELIVVGWKWMHGDCWFHTP